MEQLKVLKLGWEFPPLINGGLGVACHGLSVALSKLVDLQVILPKADTAHRFEGFGVTSLKDCQSTVKEEKLRRFASIHHIQSAQISPYYSDETTHTVREEGAYTEHTYRQCGFQIDELYGEDVGQKVYEFSQAIKVEALKHEFDLIHAHDWMTYQAGVELKQLTGKPLVVHLHASQYDRAGPEARGWIYDIERSGMHAADLVIPVSNYTAQIVHDHYGVPQERIATVHNGAEFTESYKSEKKFPEKVVLFLGRLTAQKGPEFFLEIASHVLAQNSNVRFVMAGTGEKMRQLIESGAFKGLGGRFHFTGFLDKQRVQRLLSMTDVYCMPSVSEPFGLSALEAAQFGIPAVISKQSGAAEILQGALTADYWDTQLMAQHINALLTDEELYREVVTAAHDDIKAATWDAAAAKITALYQQVLEKN